MEGGKVETWKTGRLADNRPSPSIHFSSFSAIHPSNLPFFHSSNHPFFHSFTLPRFHSSMIHHAS